MQVLRRLRKFQEDTQIHEVTRWSKKVYKWFKKILKNPNSSKKVKKSKIKKMLVRKRLWVNKRNVGPK